MRSEYLPSAYEQSDNLVRWLGDTVEGPGVTAKMNMRDHGAIAGTLLNSESFGYLITEMLKSGLLEGQLGSWKYENDRGGTTYQGGGMARATLSFAGWGRYKDLKRGVASGNIAFMAMQYQDAELDRQHLQSSRS